MCVCVYACVFVFGSVEDLQGKESFLFFFVCVKETLKGVVNVIIEIQSPS